MDTVWAPRLKGSDRRLLHNWACVRPSRRHRRQPDGSPEPADAGFTLVEIVAVCIILGVMAALVVPRYIDLDQSAKNRAVRAGISELNGRESLGWAQVKTTSAGWQSDADLFSRIDYRLGSEYSWISGPDHGAGTAEGGGTLQFQNGFNTLLGRIDSTLLTPAYWYRK